MASLQKVMVMILHGVSFGLYHLIISDYPVGQFKGQKFRIQLRS